MRKFVVFTMVLALLLVVGCPKKEKEVENVTDILPENTEVMVKLGSIETIYKHFSISETSAFGKPIENLEEIKAKLGFNPFNLDELTSNGFDTGKEFGVVVTDIVVEENADEPNFNALVFIPVTDGKKALDTIKSALQKESSGGNVTEEGDMIVFEEESSKDKAYMASKNNYLFIAVNPKVDAKPFMESALAGETSLTKGKSYQDVVSKVGSGEEIFVYANIARIAEKNVTALKSLSKQSTGAPGAPDMSAGLDYLAEYEGAGMSLDLENPNFVLKSIVNVASGAKSLKIWEGVEMNKNAVLGFPDNPVLLVSAAVNIAEYYKLIVEALSEEDANNMKTQLEGLKAMVGIDIENEVINNMAGNLNLGVYDGGSITMENFNTLLTLTVKDEAVMNGVIEKAIATLPPPQQSMVSQQSVGDVNAYVVMAGMTQVYASIKDKNFVLATGKPMFEKALAGDVSSGFTAKMEDKDLAEKLKAEESIFYLNIDETMKLVGNFEMFLQGFTGGQGIDQKTQDTVGKFEYVLATNKLDGNSIVGELVIKTKFAEPFFIEVANLAKSFEPQ